MAIDEVFEQKVDALMALESQTFEGGALGNAEEAAILLGDTPYDIDAARRASVETVALLTGGWDADIEARQ